MCRAADHLHLRSGQAKLPVAAGILMLAVLAGFGIWWYYSNQPGIPPGPTQAKYSPEDLSLAVEAVAAAEDADFARAIELWQALSDIAADDEAIRINQAVTVLKWIDETNNILSSGRIGDQAQREALERELETAYLKADEVITELSGLESADYRATLLQAALLEAKARRLQYPADLELRRQAAEVLADSLSKDPAQPLLACKFDELVQEVATEGDTLASLNADALFASWQVQPRNLYLLARAADTLLKNEDKRLLDLLDPSLELTKPMLGLVASSLGRVNPQELIDNVKQAVNEDNWRGAGRIRLWLNLFKAMSFNSDRRLVQPDILALLDTSFLNRLAAAVDVDANAAQKLPDYATSDLGAANQLAWYDMDLDLNFELLSLEGESLSLYRLNEQATFELDQVLELGFPATGFLIADLFEVDDPNRPRAPTSVAELMNRADPSETVSSPAAAGGAASLPESSRPESSGPELSGLASSDVTTSRRHDTVQEVVLWGAGQVAIVSVRANDALQKLELYAVPGESGLEGLRGITAAVPLDMESDGDLDLVFTTTNAVHIMQNNGNRTFQDVSGFSQLAGLAPDAYGFQSLVAADYDSDLDQDVLAVSGQSGSLLVLENLLHGQFRLRELSGALWPELDQPADLSIADLDGNASWDWVTCSQAGMVSVSTRNPEPGTVVPLQVARTQLAARRVTACDLNNDGFQDVVAATATGLSVYPGSTAGWASAPPQAIGNLDGRVTTLAVTDCNQDGWLDVAVVADGVIKVLLARAEAESNYLTVRVRGINDSNGGGRINHYAIGSTLEIWSGGRRQSRVVENPVSHFGLGDNSAENLRIIFTNGLTQNLEAPPSNTVVEEIQELKGSCPFIYGWDGQRFELITDLLWNAPLGLQIARGQVLPDRRWEYLLLPGDLVRPRDGAYELRLTEELWEVAYFDHVELTALDHPAEVQVFTNEKVGPPEIAQPSIFAFEKRFELRSARDSAGRDISDALRQRDGQFGQPFTKLLCQGLAQPHFVELNFGTLPIEQPLKLVMTGWLYPTDTSLNIGISQNEQRSAPEPPSLWVVDDIGNWVCAQPFMGFPGGKPKSIVVDLGNVFRSSDHRLRIGTSQQIYWDEAFVTIDTSEPCVEQPLEMTSAELGYRGFSRLLPRAPDQPHWYDYQEASRQPKWPSLAGPFTRFGDVRELLVQDDNRLVVITAGDEIILRFSAPEQELPNGWRRDFVLHSTGWDKDADLNTLAGQGSLPLPFAEQRSYPPPPEQNEQAEEVWELNKRFLTRARQFPDTVSH